MLPDNPDGWLLGINPQSFGTIGALINFSVAYAVAYNTQEPPENIQQLVEDIRVPAKS